MPAQSTILPIDLGMTWKKITSSILTSHSFTINCKTSEILLQLRQASYFSNPKHFPRFRPHRFRSNMPGLMANNAHGHSTEAHSHFDGMDEPRRIPNRLILCFDGTGNTFLGNTGDTNIVKLYNKFDRSATHQMHYYQREWSPHHSPSKISPLTL